MKAPCRSACATPFLPLLLLFAAAAGVVSLTYNGYLANRQVEQDAMSDLTQHLSRLAATTEYLLLSNDLPRVQEEIAALGADPHIVSAILADDTDTVVAALQRGMIGRPVDSVLPQRSAEDLEARTARMKRVRGTMAGEVSLRPDRLTARAVYPVLLGNAEKGLRPSRIGLIYVLSDVAALKAQARRNVERQVLQYSAMLALLAALLWLVFHYLLERPVGKLVAASARFAGGDLSVRAGLAGRSELATLGLAFDRMVEQVAESQRALAKSEERFSTAFQANPDLTTISRMADGRFLDVNAAFVEATGYGRDEIVGRSTAEIGLWVELKEQELMMQKLREQGRVSSVEARYRTKSGELRLALFSGVLIDVEGEPCLLAAGKDITARKRMEEQLYAEKERAQVTLHAIGDAVITTDAQGHVELLNPAAEQLLGWGAAEATGVAVTTLFTVINEFTGEAVENPVQKCLREGETVEIASYCMLVTRDGREVAVEDSAAPIRDREGQVVGTVVVLRDVSRARTLARELSWQASHDALTGLMNRREFEEHLSHAIATAREGGEHHALLYLDLDQFKIVNDTCGHVAGDELLRQLSELIQSHMRDSDTFARLGGDEFGVLLQHCPLEQAQRVADALRQAVRNFHFVWENKSFDIGVSIGLVSITATSGPVQSVLSAADMACYAAKDGGRNRVHVYRDDDAALVQRHGEMQWVARITRAFEEKRFRLFRQSIVDVMHPQNIAEHYEVLIRLLDEQGGIVEPATFLPAAERYGMMPSVDRWVIRSLFTSQGERLREAWSRCRIATGKCGCMYSINLSGATLGDDTFVAFVREQLLEFAIPPGVLCFEITETAAIANLLKAAHFIRELKALGCRFSLDDFGSGVSSFAYLKNLPVDFLKIDGSFVRDMVTDPIDRAMVQSINSVGHVMGIGTIAEFVESDAILAVLREIGVDYAQGYGIAKPCAIEP